MLSFIAWFFVSLLTLSLCFAVIGGVYAAGWKFLIKPVFPNAYHKHITREGWWGYWDVLVWIGALVANAYVHIYFDLFGIFLS